MTEGSADTSSALSGTHAQQAGPADRRRLARRTAWIVVAAAVAWGLVVAAVVARRGGAVVDDMFITYRYAENLATGNGFVYNPGERVFGLTNPGLGLLLALLHLLSGAEIPALASAVTGVSLLAAALLLLFEGTQSGRTPEALIGGSMVIASGYVWRGQGGAAATVVALLVAAALLSRRRPAVAGVVAGVAVWLRPDAALGAGLLALLLWREDRRLPTRYAGAAGLVVAVGALAALAYFGAVLPVTLESKQTLDVVAGGSGTGLGFWPPAAGLWKRTGGPTAMSLLWVGVLGQLAMLRGGGRGARLLAAFAVGLAVAYPLLGVPFFVWYSVPVAVAVLYGVPWLAVGLGRAAAARGRPGAELASGGLVALALVPLLAPFAERTLHDHRSFEWNSRLVVYRQAAEWIRDSTPADADLACTEIGVVGYYSRRHVEDPLGLVTPRSLPWVARGDLRGGFLEKPTDLVVTHTGRNLLGVVTETDWFRRAYRPATRFPLPSGNGEVVVFERLPGAELPAPPPRT